MPSRRLIQRYKRDLQSLSRQKRPIIQTKETYYYLKEVAAATHMLLQGLHVCNKVAASTHMLPQGLHICHKVAAPTHMLLQCLHVRHKRFDGGQVGEILLLRTFTHTQLQLSPNRKKKISQIIALYIDHSL